MNKRLKKLLTILPLFAAGIATPIALTSCGSTSSIIPDVKTVTFKAKQSIKNTKETVTPTTPNKPTTLEVLDPNVNANAQEQAKNTFKSNLKIKNLQTDMDQVLSKFYNTYEYESETEAQNGNKTEVEAEVEKIEVLDIDKDLNAKLKVFYKVETEVDTDVDTKDNEKTEIVHQEKKLKLTPRFATTTEIQSITQMLKNAKENNKENDSKFETDLGDLIDLYIGDNEDGEKSIFEQVGVLTTESKYGGLLGYGIKISDLAYTPKNRNLKLKANRITGNETIFAPSAVITEFYVPNSSVTTADGIDITIDYTKVSKLTEADVLGIKKVYKETTPSAHTPPSGDSNVSGGGSSQSKTTSETTTDKYVLNDILVTLIEKKDGVEVSVEIKKDENNQAAQNFLTVDITFKTNPTEAEGGDSLANITVVRISIDGNWLAPSTPTQQK